MSNLYQSMLALLSPKQPQFVVSVTAVYGDGTSRVAFEGGAEAIAQGDSVAAGQKAFAVMVDGHLEIRGNAPNLDRITMDIS